MTHRRSRYLVFDVKISNAERQHVARINRVAPIFFSPDCADALAENDDFIVGNATGAALSAGCAAEVAPATARFLQTAPGANLAETALAAILQIKVGRVNVAMELRNAA
jgi:hypothetical protein